MKITKTSFLLKIILAALAVYAIVSLIGIQAQLDEAEKQKEVLSGEVTAQEQANAKLKEELEQAGDSDYVERVARDELGMVKRGEIVFYDVGN